MCSVQWIVWCISNIKSILYFAINSCCASAWWLIQWQEAEHYWKTGKTDRNRIRGSPDRDRFVRKWFGEKMVGVRRCDYVIWWSMINRQTHPSELFSLNSFFLTKSWFRNASAPAFILAVWYIGDYQSTSAQFQCVSTFILSKRYSIQRMDDKSKIFSLISLLVGSS